MSLHLELRRFTRFGLTGVMTNGALYLTFLAMIWAMVPPMLASALAYALGLALSYVVNRSWSFRSTGSHRREVPRFLIAYALGFGVTMGSMWLLLKFMGPALAQFLTIGITGVSIYVFLRLLRFGSPV